MLFNSWQFLLFLPIVFILYWFVFRSKEWRNLLVVVASYVFYGWWDWRFLSLIALSSGSSFASGLLIERYAHSRRMQKTVSAGNIVLNLLILGVFKYFNFFVDNLDALMTAVGFKMDWVTLSIILPVGISFYTFQALSYTIDVYRGKIKATHNVVDFFAFISFFPQLVAGPIERATSLLPQFQRNRFFDEAKATDGCRQMLWGFFKKIVVADSCAGVVNGYWEGFAAYSGIQLLLLAILFTFQIYGDFSGYSDIAIGCARLFGINLMQNFNYPYFSRNIGEFWRRWHISLTTWFRDYIYFPLGGSRQGKWKTIRNIFIVWAISGLWHGANWTFIAWGVYHATLLSAYILLGIGTKYQQVVAVDRGLPTIKELAQMTLTFFFAVIGWILFRSTDIGQSMSFISRMFAHMTDVPNGLFGYQALLWCTLLVGAEWLSRRKHHALEYVQTTRLKNRLLRWSIYMAISVTCLYLSSNKSDFIYFQF